MKSGSKTYGRLRSSTVTVKEWEDKCDRIFGKKDKKSENVKRPVSSTNDKS